MRSAALQSAEFTPVFNWSPPRSRKRSLISFIIASATLHALCFYLFQIIYPPTVALLPPPGRINMITPDSEDGRLLLRWIEAEDPALSSTTQRPPQAATLQLPQPTYIPSYAGRQPALREPAPYRPDLSVPSARPPGPVPLPRVSAPPQAVTVRTSVRFDEQGVLGSAEIPAVQFTPSRNEPPQAAQFRVAIGPRGDVRHCFLETSSEDPALDEQARAYLLRCRFPAIQDKDPKTPNSLTWTTATIEWGNDFSTPAKPATDKPSP